MSVDDQEDRELARSPLTHPNENWPAGSVVEITDGRAALAALPLDAIGYVGHTLYDGKLLAHALLVSKQGQRERWGLFVGGLWTVDVVLDGDRIAAIALRKRLPPPF